MSNLIAINDFYSDEKPEVKKISQASEYTVEPESTGFDLGFVGDIFTYIFYFIIFLIVVWIGLKITQIVVRKKHKIGSWKNKVFFEILAPLENQEDAKKDSGMEKSEEKDVIGIGEQVYTILQEYTKPGIKSYLYGNEAFSLEIMNVDSKIRFWFSCDKKIAPVIQKQIISTYPKVNINVLKETKFFKEGYESYVQQMGLQNRWELPFRTYKDLEKDPLNSLTNSLSGIEKEESAGFQIIISPVKNGWQKGPQILAEKIQQGQNPREILYPKWHKVFGKVVKEFFSIFKSKDKNDFGKSGNSRDIDYSGTKEAIQLTPQQQEIIKKLEEKSSKGGFHFTLRVAAAAKTKEKAKRIVEQILPTFQMYDIKPFNNFKKLKTNQKKAGLDFLLRAPSHTGSIVNSEELNSIWHIPNYLVKNSNINWLLAKKPALPSNLPEKDDQSIYIGEAESGMDKKPVYLKQEDRFRHNYVLGGTGSGKSVFLTNVVLQDIALGNGVCIVDPHGETVDDILLRMPKERRDDVIVFSPAMTDKPLGLNMLQTDPDKPEEKTLMIDTLFTIWDKLYDLKATGGPMFESYMKNSMRLVMGHEESGSTLMEISKVLQDEDYRTFKLAMCEDQQVVDFWEKEAQKAGGEASLENMVPYITSKLAPFVNNDFIRPMVGQQKSAINFREAMDQKKIVLVKLEKGLIGETSAYLVGMVIIGSILMAGMGRNDGLRYNKDGTKDEILAKDRPPFFVYIDEMQNFLFDAIPQALEEIRKYKIGFTLAHQFVKQVVQKGDERIKDSIMANTGNKFIFRAGPDDAELLLKEFAPTLTASDLQSPERFTCNCVMLVNGQKTTPFNVKPPMFSEEIDVAFKAQLIQDSKDKYGTTKENVEKNIKERVEKFMF